MKKMGQKIRKAIQAAIAELEAMDKNELRSEIQAREIGEIGSVLVETGTLETGPLHVGIDIPLWDEPSSWPEEPPSWVCLELREPVAVSCFVSSSGKPSEENAALIGADDYHYSVAA